MANTTHNDLIASTSPMPSESPLPSDGSSSSSFGLSGSHRSSSASNLNDLRHVTLRPSRPHQKGSGFGVGKDPSSKEGNGDSVGSGYSRALKALGVRFSTDLVRTSLDGPVTPTTPTAEGPRAPKSILNRHPKPFHSVRVHPRSSIQIPITPTLPTFFTRSSVTALLNPFNESHLLIVQGNGRSVAVAQHLLNRSGNSYKWIEWLDANSADVVNKEYRAMVKGVVVPAEDVLKESLAEIHGDDVDLKRMDEHDIELWLAEARFEDLLGRVAATFQVAAKRFADGSSGAKKGLDGLVVSTERRGSSGSFLDIGSPISPLASTVMKDSGWFEDMGTGDGEVNNDSEGSFNGKTANASYTSHLPTIVFENVSGSAWGAVCSIILAHRGSRFIIITKEDTPDEGFRDVLEKAAKRDRDHHKNQLLPLPEIRHVYLPKWSEEEAKALVVRDLSDLGDRDEDREAISRLVRSVGTAPLNLTLATCSIKGRFGSRIDDYLDCRRTLQSRISMSPPTTPSKQDHHDAFSSSINMELKMVFDLLADMSNRSLPVWSVLVLCASQSHRGVDFNLLSEVAREMLQSPDPADDGMELELPDMEDDNLSSCAMAQVLLRPRVEEIQTKVMVALEKCVTLLASLGLLQVSGEWPPTPSLETETNFKIQIPRAVMDEVYSVLSSKTHQLTGYFFQSLRFQSQRDLFTAAITGAAGLVPLLVERGHDPHSPIHGVTPLHLAVIKGQIDTATMLVSSGGPELLDVQDLQGRTPLFYATSWNRMDGARFLLATGANVNTPETVARGAAPIHVASAKGYNRLCTLLIRHKALRNHQMAETKETPLHLAVRGGHYDTVVVLRRCGCSVNVADSRGLPALHSAVAAEDSKAVATLLEWASPPSQYDSLGHTPLHIAASVGNIEIAKMLLAAEGHASTASATHANATTARSSLDEQRGEEVELPPVPPASPPLHSEALSVVVAAAQKKGPLFQAMTTMRSVKELETPLHVAIKSGHFEMVKFLCAADPQVVTNGRDHLYETQFSKSNREDVDDDSPPKRLIMPPLHLATTCNRTDMMKVIIDTGTSLDHLALGPTGSHITALHLSAMLPDHAPEPMKLLLDLGANVNAQSSKKRTPLGTAAARGRVGHVKTLLAHGAAVDGLITGATGKTPLTLAASFGHVECVRILADAGGKLHVSGAALWKRSAAAANVDPARIAEIVEILKKRK
ncbi:Transient receptor putative cation channel sub A member 1 [Blyttiomyces sp. JEL0837]|nr:Transient receptor putative cation channel sub A member 1 [Blyttiomyces sp. JEL0837]